MDDRELKQAKERLAGLDKALSSLAIKQRTVEAKLANEHDAVRKCASQRAAVVGGLIDSDEEAAKKLHRQLDGLDAQIRVSERMAESYQALLRTIAGELADTTSQRDRLNAIVAAENTSEFAAWTVAMQEHFTAAHAAMAAAREALGKLTTEAARGGERFAGQAHTWSAERFDRFEHQQSNPEQLLGFKIALPFYRSIVLHVAPMTRGSGDRSRNPQKSGAASRC